MESGSSIGHSFRVEQNRRQEAGGRRQEVQCKGRDDKMAEHRVTGEQESRRGEEL